MEHEQRIGRLEKANSWLIGMVAVQLVVLIIVSLSKWPAETSATNSEPLVERIIDLELAIEAATKSRDSLQKDVADLKKQQVDVAVKAAGMLTIVMAESELKCRGLVITDKDGKERIQLTTAEETGDGIIRLMDERGTVRAGFEMAKGMSFLRLQDSTQRPRLLIGVHESGLSTMLQMNGDGLLQTSYGVDGGVPKLIFHDRAGEPKSVLQGR